MKGSKAPNTVPRSLTPALLEFCASIAPAHPVFIPSVPIKRGKIGTPPRYDPRAINQVDNAANRALAAAAVPATSVDRVFLTGGSSLVPAVRRMFTEQFGEDRVAGGEELTSIAHGLALVGHEEYLADWSAA